MKFPDLDLEQRCSHPLSDVKHGKDINLYCCKLLVHGSECMCCCSVTQQIHMTSITGLSLRFPCPSGVFFIIVSPFRNMKMLERLRGITVFNFAGTRKYQTLKMCAHRLGEMKCLPQKQMTFVQIPKTHTDARHGNTCL